MTMKKETLNKENLLKNNVKFNFVSFEYGTFNYVGKVADDEVSIKIKLNAQGYDEVELNKEEDFNGISVYEESGMLEFSIWLGEELIFSSND